MNSYSKLRNNHEYQIELARAERVGIMATRMWKNYWREDMFANCRCSEEPENAKQIREDLRVQNRLIEQLHLHIGRMVSDAIRRHLGEPFSLI